LQSLEDSLTLLKEEMKEENSEEWDLIEVDNGIF
jgi:hypothetical protein